MPRKKASDKDDVASKPKHTPTPWFLFDNGHCVGGPFEPDRSFGDPEQTTAGIAMCGMRLRTHEEQEANAKLIVHAVNCHEDLLAACIAAKSILMANIPPDNFDGHAARALVMVRDAIEKANGRN